MKYAMVGITPENLLKSAEILNILLADEYVLYTKTKNAHWNIEGSDFFEKHKIFELLYEQLDEMIDEVAERIRSLGHYPIATLKGFLQKTHLSESTREKNNSIGFIKEVLTDHESIIVHLRENINHIANHLHDLGTGDFMTGIMEKHEKMAWMLRAHLD